MKKMIVSKKFLLVWLLWVAVIALAPVWASPADDFSAPLAEIFTVKYSYQKINLQGKLTATGGAAVSGPQSLTFKIWDVASGGTAPLWTETQPSVKVDAGGIFNVYLGSVTAIPFVFDPLKDYYLGITVGTGTEMTPRQQLVAVPLANSAYMSRNLKGGVVWATGNPAISAEAGSSAGRRAIYAVGNGSGANWQHTNAVGYFRATASTGYVKGIYSTAEGAGVDANGWGTWGMGLWGRAYQRGTGVVGQNVYTATDNPNFTNDEGMGVKGTSVWGYGVFGKSEGSNKIFGYLGSRNYGVYGRYNTGGSDRSYGYLGSNMEGVYGRYNNGTRDRSYGYLGSSAYGAFGRYIETDGAEGPYGYLGARYIGVYGRADVSGGTGVWGSAGYTGSIGVYGESDAPGGIGVRGRSSGGHGVKGQCTSTNEAGLYGENTNLGMALELGEGKIKIRSHTDTISAYSSYGDTLVPSSGTVSAALGSITCRATGSGTYFIQRNIRVNNTYVNSNSVIFLAGDTSGTYDSCSVIERGDGYFRLVFKGEARTINYLVVN